MGEEIKGGLDFGQALALVRGEGKRVARAGWNGKGMFIYLVDGSTFTVNRAPLNKHFAEGTEVVYRAHVDMQYADGTLGVWSPSNSDILATDWFEVE